MNFKAWLNTLLNEFNITNLYDFYALELGKNQVQSYGDSLQDKEINAKIIQTGNDLLEDINDSLEIILLDRFIPPILDLYRVYGFRLGSFEDYLNHEAPEYVDKIMEYFPLYRNKEFRMRFYDDIISDKSWIKKLYKYTKQEQKEHMDSCIDEWKSSRNSYIEMKKIYSDSDSIISVAQGKQCFVPGKLFDFKDIAKLQCLSNGKGISVWKKL